MSIISSKKLDPAVERQHRRNILFNAVPRLLDEELAPALGGWRFLFMARLFLLAPFYRKRFATEGDDRPLREVKKTFLLVGVLYKELAKRIGDPSALAITQTFLYRLACVVQRQAYFPPPGQPRTWDHFHREHEAQMEEGFISHNENDGVLHTDATVTMHITRCRFHECFRDMGNAAITEAFCRSDEMVFNEYSPLMRFHRGGQVPDTIARGALRCTFSYERLPSPWDGGVGLRRADLLKGAKTEA
ncbi:L-2-amino-thiazoline-4-carboxylic acid hydrolase [Rhodoferax sp.]|uniref:L-2-amino-thiazoline-4-carboxylic acid hydrolase n=1 Tax=Rhodoferax sp. TaxID=50421 RepID=UPI001EBC35FF|nr:L-2-amino-thiazoline-4-carboxylic acid hydrolase [Rhodoferax sp.]MBT9508634.1 L-2-amino-thiazoline-4-carboxylic acid hydrolase [Rhodoferax sp.]